jgi:hypothetical protein
MGRIKSKVLVAALLLLATSSAWAGDWIFGAKTGPVMFDVSGISDATNTGVMVGYEQGVVLGDLALEGEYTTTTGSGELNNKDVDVNTKAIYLALRTAGPFYFKAKGGYLKVDGDIGASSISDSGASYGVGFGLGLGIVQFELEYTQTSLEDTMAFASLGVQF